MNSSSLIISSDTPTTFEMVQQTDFTLVYDY